MDLHRICTRRRKAATKTSGKEAELQASACSQMVCNSGWGGCGGKR